ncbi:MAG TPA: LysM peptidoglycan-binding domain-containing protein [Bacteriovoracaceae bacterium]|nr:LysM peptidoglycan-binding domain-containing protein [Bacteriovoracaceae bacterium]
MRKDPALLFFLLLMSTSTLVEAQEDVDEDDLQSLMNDKTEVKEVSEAAEASSEAPAVKAPSDAQAPGPETGSGAEQPPEPTEDPSAAKTTEAPAADDEAEGVSESGAETANDATDTVDLDSLEKIENPTGTESTADAPADTGDDLESLKKDTDEDIATKSEPESKDVAKKDAEPAVFDVGREERELLTVAQNIQGQISDNEWNEVATTAKVDSYTVVKDEWLFKISKRLFGTGFYYPKIWSLNSFITNPHFIEPGMVLSFTTGSGSAAPEVKLGTFTPTELEAIPGSIGTANASEFANFGEDVKPGWVEEKNQLTEQGVYFQYSSEETMEDIQKASELALNREYENYEPPRRESDIDIPKNYDKVGFDKNSKIYYSVKEGFYLNTFVSTNMVQDFGSLTNGANENIFFTAHDNAYVQFDESMKVLPGDRFSIYTSGGKVKHSNSDREGYKYSIVGQIKLLRKIKEKWEVQFFETTGSPQRGDRITAYTPKIERITKTFNSRMVEAAILATYQPNQTIIGFGDVVYLDRGRADGLELGNVMEVFGFKDRLSKRNITDQPTYKTGEITIITLTDNFATALVTNSLKDFYSGDIAITKTKESRMREMKAKDAKAFGQKEMMGGKALDELDVELNLENLNDDLLKQADKIQLTEDELAELERQEREKSVIKDSERDLKALERLENEIEQAEGILNDAKLDEDKLLENENLNDIEKKSGNMDQDSLNEIEENLGKRYIDEDLNSKENPFGLSEFDIEEVDELLNTEKNGKDK